MHDPKDKSIEQMEKKFPKIKWLDISLIKYFGRGHIQKSQIMWLINKILWSTKWLALHKNHPPC